MRLVRYSYPNSRNVVPSSSFARSPWSGIEAEMNRLFEAALTDLTAPAFNGSFAVDLYEDKDNTYVRAELPGVDRDAISVEVVDGYLNLQATRKSTSGEAEQNVSFSRSISLSEDVRTDQVSAHYENGVLTVTLPKKEEAKPRKITVQVK